MITGFYACKSDQKDSTDTKSSADTLKKESLKNATIGAFEPPDSTYTGDYFEKYPSGVIKVRGFFKFGKKSGKWMYFFPNGTIWSEAFFKNDKMDGESHVYHPNGKLMYSGYYKMDKADSVWSFYDSIGKLIEHKDYNQIRKNKK